ncbi:MAG: histidinol-phosphate transaminase [Alphaproteobacteria bacterium]|nr:histidinol-phosphate transaminase [Alphaproteobacteria bacterium]
MSQLKPQPRAALMAIRPYQPGRATIDDMADAPKNIFKLSSNESALGPSPQAVLAYQQAAESLALYPDGGALDLRAALADLYNLPQAQFICGGGSDEILQLLAYAYLQAGDEAIHTAHGFLIYRLVTQAAGGIPKSVPEPNLKPDVELILQAVTDKTRIIFLANPNNPTGTILTGEELHYLHARLRGDILLVLDEAYGEYVTDSAYASGLTWFAPDKDKDENKIRAHNIIVTRTFSKIYGLASLRLGYAFAAPPIIDALNRLRGAFNVNNPALQAGVAALRDQTHIAKSQAYNEKWRNWLVQEISAAGFETINGAGNFLLIKCTTYKDPKTGQQIQITTEQIDKSLCARGIIARDIAAYHLADYLRLTVGTEKANRAVVKAFTEIGAQLTAAK